jgi:hypothetical protein
MRRAPILPSPRLAWSEKVSTISSQSSSDIAVLMSLRMRAMSVREKSGVGGFVSVMVKFGMWKHHRVIKNKGCDVSTISIV